MVGKMWPLLILLIFKEVGCNHDVQYEISKMLEFDELNLNSLHGISLDCFKAMEYLVLDDRSTLFTMFDSMSKPSGIFKGNVRDYGNYDECIEIDKNMNGVQVYGQYCAGGLNYKLDKLQLSFSVCIPSVCSLKEVSSVFIPLKNVSFSDTACHTKLANSEFDTGDWAMSGVLLAIFSIIIASTTYDVITQNHNKEIKHDILVAFSVYTNGKNLLKTSNSPELIHCLNGLRFISMLWVIAGHRFASTLAVPMINTVDAMEFQNGFESFYIQGARVAVDTFFFMSAFLSSYMYFKKVEKRPLTFRQLPVYYLHRFLRITPAVAAMYFMHLTLMRRIGSGPIWPIMMEYTEKSCKKWWWSFFLYIQNYVNYDDMCIIPTWYLSADMQMFILAPFLIIPLGCLVRKGKKFAAYLLCTIAFIVCILAPMLVDLFRENNNEYDTHTRLSVYIIGIFMGMIMPELRKKKTKFNSWMNVIIWTVTLTVMFVIVAYTQEVRTNVTYLKTNLFHTFSRPIWTFGLCWIVYSCTMGSGGLIAWILSRPIFQVLGKLCYCMYLLHNPIITISIGTARTGIYFSSYNIIYFWCGDLIFTLILSVIWYLTFESPMILVEKIIFGGKPKPKPNDAAALPAKIVV